MELFHKAKKSGEKTQYHIIIFPYYRRYHFLMSLGLLHHIITPRLSFLSSPFCRTTESIINIHIYNQSINQPSASSRYFTQCFQKWHWKILAKFSFFKLCTLAIFSCMFSIVYFCWLVVLVLVELKEMLRKLCGSQHSISGRGNIRFCQIRPPQFPKIKAGVTLAFKSKLF